MHTLAHICTRMHTHAHTYLNWHVTGRCACNVCVRAVCCSVCSLSSHVTTRMLTHITLCKSLVGVHVYVCVCACSVLQCVVVWACVRRREKMICTHCITLQHTTTHCNALQHTVSHYNTQYTLQYTASHYNTQYTLQHIATHCITLHHTMQHTATHCNTLTRAWYTRIPIVFCISIGCCDLTLHGVCVHVPLCVSLYVCDCVFVCMCVCVSAWAGWYDLTLHGRPVFGPEVHKI